MMLAEVRAGNLIHPKTHRPLHLQRPVEARRTRLELATSGSTVRGSNQLSYRPIACVSVFDADACGWMIFYALRLSSGLDIENDVRSLCLSEIKISDAAGAENTHHYFFNTILSGS